MDRYKVFPSGEMGMYPAGNWTPYADAQATVEALQAQLREGEAAYHNVGEYNDRLKQQVEALQRERDALEAKCLEEHVTIEQADAKVMKLEGEKGMWANERTDLLTQLENAEFALDAEREKVRGLHEVTKVICAHCCEPMEIPSKAVLQTQLTQLQALVRAAVERWRAQTNVKEGISFRMAMKELDATLPATPTEEGT